MILNAVFKYDLEAHGTCQFPQEEMSIPAVGIWEQQVLM